ncbi:hypothetical protein [Photobacterium atrarenae]|uniref:TMhelix containing protein n=1 Tax=Photobacterium atrarenae TaxID=865757 RepID=A0ABY5GGT1_9GAMM|nr:hypothetical protein [Photobacterium atrarenae]UTV28444.1 hypothetical protein NNL38_04140 [Photobacterium atrarenae]
MNDKTIIVLYLALLVSISSLWFDRFLPYIIWIMSMTLYVSCVWVDISRAEKVELSGDTENEQFSPLLRGD